MTTKKTATATATKEATVFNGVTTDFVYDIVEFEGLQVLQLDIHGYNKEDGKKYSYSKYFEILVDNITLVKFACFKAIQTMQKREEEVKGYVLFGSKNGLIPDLQSKGWISEAI